MEGGFGCIDCYASDICPDAILSPDNSSDDNYGCEHHYDCYTEERLAEAEYLNDVKESIDYYYRSSVRENGGEA